MTDDADFFTAHLDTPRLMVILRGLGTEQTLRLCRRAQQCGAGLVEVPVQSPAALTSLAAAVAWGAEAAVPVGAGTVISPRLHQRVVAAGAAFTVAPGLDEDVLAEARETGVPHLPGVATATEIQQAIKAGYTWLKAFPASSLSPDWFRAVRAPFPDIRLVATGGVHADNAEAYLDAGVDAVSLGSSFEGAALKSVRALRKRT
ncbi:bifunctional 4-hydroxy-2-oxoglutarate aldolase/2-dehydro-3-deoxy-phosphogluconate aldolase [Streptomyces sp. 6N223]|uniref:bifunctional 4-hydroxy-2-oxoglutarate aldolase/2-dehydro-3-deoxy-phosphogluconate aldolase n=1 Tax=Streptomyces sp. 6N223 TaxID=3457412 RepID=UPI003FD245EB